MPAHKLGRLWKFLASDVDAWVKGGKAAVDVEAPSDVTPNANRANPEPRNDGPRGALDNPTNDK